MGLVKQHWIDSQERGWSTPDSFVCEECIDDEFLRGIVRDNAAKKECSYCGRKETKPIAASLEDILPYIAGAFFQHFEEPGAAGLPRDSGEWVGEDLITDTADAFLSLGLSVESKLFKDICNSFNNYAWVPAVEGSWLGEHEHQRLSYSWEDFTQRTKHTSRYFFFHENQEDSEIRSGYSPGQILKKIGDISNLFAKSACGQSRHLSSSSSAPQSRTGTCI